jgi:flagellar hook-associated protein FlgK
MASSDSIGLSGLLTSQRLLDLTGQNVANAQTPGYHRQVANLAARNYGTDIGLGVEITDVRRVLNQSLEQAITRNIFALSEVSAQLETLQQIEQQLKPGDGSLLDLWEQIRNQVITLAGKPDDETGQRVLLNRVTALGDKINAVHTELRGVQADLDIRLREATGEINDLAVQIAELNQVIARNTIQGTNANDLSDKRDQLVNRLAELIDVRTVPQDHGVVNVFAAGVPLVVGNQSLTLEFVIDPNGQAGLAPANLPLQMILSGGEVHGLLELRNQTVADVVSRLESWTAALVRTMDGVQATGIGQDGPFTTLFGQRPVDNINLPLDNAGLTFPPQAGTLYATVTDQTTGQRTLHALAIDPATQDLQDIAAAFSAIPNLQGIVDTQTRTLTVVAQPGFTFDFAGRLPSAPETVAISGTAAPQVDGVYTGASNDVFTFTVVGSGTIGVTPGLTLEARNSAGQLLASFNIGQGYEPGTVLGPVEGVGARLNPGTVNNGDNFGARVIAEPDAAGLLTALGLNTFFEGDQAGTLKLSPALRANPDLLSGTRTGLPADGSNWRRLAAEMESPLLAGGASNMRKFLSDLIADVGSRVQDLDQRQTALESLGQGLEVERQSISGVDPNEELLRLLQYQRSFQMSARFLTVVNETLQDLFLLV